MGERPVFDPEGNVIGVVLSVEERPGGVYFTAKLDDVDELQARRVLHGGRASIQIGRPGALHVDPPLWAT